jgi:hypothetical protein
MAASLHRPAAGRLALAEGEEVLRSLDGLAEPPQELLQIRVALDEVDIGGVYHQKI